MMFRFIVKKHSEITKELLNEIIHIKSIAWPYSYDKQMQWIENNIKPEDFHVILSCDGRNVAYLNLIAIEFAINETPDRGYGIGNVCAVEKRKGYGRELMMQTNHFLISNKSVGVLLCKEQLVDFYKKINWTLLDKAGVSLNFDKTKIEIMLYNTEEKVLNFAYTEFPF